MEDIVLIGGGGHALSVADAIVNGVNYKIMGYTDLSDNHIPLRYLGTDDILKSLFERGVMNAAITVGYLGKSNIRDRLYYMVKQTGIRLPEIIDPSAVISATADVGEGVFIGKNAVVNAGTKIGKMCIINTGAIIEHNNRIGEYSHIAVGAVLCGDVHVGEHTFIGANATIIQGVQIGMNVIIGAGSIVIGNVPDNGRVIGVGG
ncbi:NeuD/PglB/VioB family sugar acetyltransferase [Acetatifactor muris]|uniref:NeuD/PglB/VioB family sugar acetyltransferase n=1 Tax=Acetatifactor muris TaxID=879566 RepID=UPI0023F22ACD|nr:NeuD/PglB/VioB family sugar acetyltransferase [Acetatifactor muris]